MSKSQRIWLSGSHVCEDGGETGMWSSNVTMEHGHLRTWTRDGGGAEGEGAVTHQECWSGMSS